MYGHVITKFSGMVDYHISLAMGLCPRARFARGWSSAKKTKFMVFKPRQKRSICNMLISIDNQNIVEVKETNFLGVILDENLTWKSEMSHFASKLRSQSV